MKVFITGAAGFIGFHVTRKLLERGDEVVGIDSLNDYYDPRLKRARLAELGVVPSEAESGEVSSSTYPRFRFARLSLEDRAGMESLFDRHAFDAACNLAAQAGVRYSIENPYSYVSANVTGFLSVLECCRHASVAHLVYASSSSVYGLDARLPMSTRDAVDHPISLYAASKRADELMAHAYSHLFGLATTGLRFFTVYGPWGRPDMAYYKFARAILDGDPIEVYSNGDVSRDFTFIDDAADAVLKALDRVPRASPGSSTAPGDPSWSRSAFRLYNVGNNSSQRLSAFLDVLETCLGKKAVRVHKPLPASDVAATFADVTETERDLGWRPSTDIRTGLQRFTEWYLSYRSAGGR